MTDTVYDIVVIDDDSDFREIISSKLMTVGFQVRQASSGMEGIEKCKSKIPNLILLDVQMPEMNGIQTISELKKISDMKNVPIFFLTNYGAPQAGDKWLDIKFAQDIGAVGYLRKTDDLQDILNQIIAYIKSVRN